MTSRRPALRSGAAALCAAAVVVATLAPAAAAGAVAPATSSAVAAPLPALTGALGVAPLGSVDTLVGIPTGVEVSGWALDPETTASSYVWVDVAGKGQLVRASTERPDVGRLFPTYGSAHGFSATIAAPAGRHQVCVTAINVASGPHTSLGCRTVTVPTTAPLGSMDSATAVTGGVRVRGWALDPQTPAPSYVWVDVAGKGQLTRASISRGDIGAAFPALGPDHGFDLTLSAPPGPQLVCATAVEVSTGPHTFLGCRTVIVPDTSPVGRVDAATPTTGGILLQGWALDPDTTASSWIWVDLDGRDGRPVRASTPRSDIAAAFPGYGPNHGFSTVLNTTPGTHTACVTAINTAAGTNKFLGCATTTVPAPTTDQATGPATGTTPPATTTPTETAPGETTPTTPTTPPADAQPAPGAVKPGAGNTGVPAGTTLKVHRGDLVITTPGTVIDGMDIYGFVTVKAADVTIKNSRVRGSGPGSFNTGLINANHSAVKNLLIEDVTLVPDFPSVWINGVLGHDFTARRVNTYNVVDGFGIYNINGPAANAVVESSWVHDLSYFSPDPNHSDNQTHNDAIQIQGGTNITIVGNYLSAYLSTTAGTQNYKYPQAGFGVILTPNVNAVSGSKINNNWLDGSYIPIKLTTGKKGPMNFGQVNANRFARDMRNTPMNGVNQWFTILMTPDMTAETLGNVYVDNGTPVTVRYDSGTSTAP